MKPLNPLMAALLAASSAAFMLPSSSFAHDAAGSCRDALKDSSSPTSDMACLLATTPAAAKDIGARFAAFLQGKDSKGRLYVTDGLLKDKTLLPAVLKIAQEWPEKNKSTPGNPVAVLYFVMGPGDAPVPDWVKASPLLAKTFTPKAPLSERLEVALDKARYTGDLRVPQKDAANATDAFFVQASSWAFTVFDTKMTQDEIRASVALHDAGPLPPDVGDRRKNPLDTTGSGFTFNDLYINGAVVQDVWGAKDDGFRRISMKMYTIKQADGTLQNMIGIVDITPGDPNTPYAPKFIPMTQFGDSKLALRDGGRKYSISIGITNGEHTISMSRDGGQALTTSQESLARARADQAADGGTVPIPAPDGPKFYMLGQGGEHGSVLFFPKEDIDGRAGAKDPRYLRPTAAGDVAKLDADGLTVPMDGHPDIGAINGKPYHFEFDFDKKMWTIKDGKGDEPKKDPATAAAGGDQPAGDQTAGQTGDQTAPQTGGAATLDQVLAMAAQAGWKEAPGNAGFNPATKAKTRIVTSVKEKHLYFMLLFDPSLGVPGNQYAFGLTVGDPPQPLKTIRGFKNYVVLEYPNSKQYFDYKDMASYVQQKDSHPLLLDPKIGMQGVTDVDVAIDMLTHYFDIKPGDPMLQTVRSRIAAHAKGDGYVINGNGKLLYMAHGEEGLEIWPDEIKSGDKGDNAGMTGLRGPGTAVTVVGGGPAEFKKEIEMAGGRTALLVKLQDKHIAIYKGQEDETLPNGDSKTADVTYIMFDYLKGASTGKPAEDKKNALQARTTLRPIFGGEGRFALPNGYQMQSLADVVMPDTAQIMLLHGSTQEKGAIAAYRYVLPDSQGGQNAKDKAGNCAGAVIWWGGLNKEQVQKACASDSKVP